MKNLFLTMSKLKSFGINFVSHRGAQCHLNPGESTKIPLIEEPYTDKEILEYYKVRYSSLGLESKILNDGTTVDDVPVNAIEEAIKNKNVKSEVKEEKKAEESEVTPLVEEDSKEEQEDDVDSWDMNTLRNFVKENNIKVEGKSRESFVKAIKEFNK